MPGAVGANMFLAMALRTPRYGICTEYGKVAATGSSRLISMHNQAGEIVGESKKHLTY